jgi:hypothetical protein
MSFPKGRKRLAAESEKCPMNSQQLTFRSIINEARVLEPLHEEANARPRGPYHFCQRFMTDLRNVVSRAPRLSKWAIRRRIWASLFSLELQRWSTKSC